MIPATASAVGPARAVARPLRGRRRRARARRWSSACSGGADSVALLVLAADAGLAPVAVHVDHGLRAGSARRSRRGRERSRRGWARRSGRCGSPSAPGPNLEARARDARYGALERARVELGAERGARRPHRRRPGRDRAAQPAAGRGRVPGSRAWRRGAGTSCGRCSRLRRADTRALCAALGLDVARRPDERRPRASAGSRSGTRCCRCSATLAERDLVPVLARQADLLRAESEFLDELGAPRRGPTPTHRRRARWSSCPVPLARRAVRRGSARRRRRRPRSSACSRSRAASVARDRARRAAARCVAPLGRPAVRRTSTSVHVRWTEQRDIGRVVVGEDELQRADRGARRSRSPPTTRAGRRCSSACSRARSCS